MQVYRLHCSSTGQKYLLPHQGGKRSAYRHNSTPITHGSGLLLSKNLGGGGLMKVTEKATSEPVNLSGVQNKLSKLTLGYGVQKQKKTFINFKL